MSSTYRKHLSTDERLQLLQLLRAEGKTREQAANRIEPRKSQQRLPLSFAQQRLWFLTQLDARAAAAYAIPGGLRLRGALNAAALHAALNRIVARHEALRTSFASVNGEPIQVIAAPEVGFALAHVDLSGQAAPEAELERIAADEAAAPFDLQTGPLVRGRLVRLADDDHVLLVTMHHIVSDGWSMGVLVNEFSALYAAFSQGQPDPLPALPIQYADYATWQRRWITGELLQRQLDFWRDHLSGAPALLELPTDRPRPALQDFVGASLGFEFDEDLTAGLKALSRRHGTTLFMTLLASWAALLARLSGQDEVVIGTPVANRHRAEVEPLIGFFVNTQALRVDLSGSPTVAELLAQVRTTALAAQDHQDIPFEQVVEAINPPRGMAHSPVFQVALTWQNAPEGTLELPGLELQAAGSGAGAAKFDLDVSLEEAGERIVGSFQYATALFDASTLDRHVVHWQTLLRALLADDQASVARLPLLSADEQHQLLHGFNDTAAPFPAERCIHELFEDQVERTPEATALVFEDTQLSYAELNARANRLAHHLIALGVQPDTRVAIALPRGIDMVVALLATLKAGGAYLPLDRDYPSKRLAFILRDAAPGVLITEAGTRAKLGALLTSLAVLELDAHDAAWHGLPDTNPDPAVRSLSSHLAYVIYTSGSTGRPKGVMVPHRAIGRVVVSNGYAAFDATDRIAFAANPAFDATTMEVWAPLLNGGCIVVIDGDDVFDPPRLAKVLERQGVTGLFLTTALFNQLALAIPASLARLKYLMCGGERNEPASFARMLAHGGPAHLIHCYGPTETTTFALTSKIGEVPAGCTNLPIGRPIAGTQVYVLDAHGQPVPVGVAGEIYIGGAGVAHGYLNRPELTAERFLPDPFGAEPGARMYRTGDLGRWRIDPHGDGTIEFLGRRDQQVKIRGFRIEPGEIEARLREHPGVHEATVLAREDTPGDKRLVAYVVGEPVSPETLRVHLATHLPEYMIPAAYVPLDALPLTPNGKLDRRALPVPEGNAFGTAAYEPPQGELETTLAALWSELLCIERVGRRDNFFELGGHSLLAVSLIERLRHLGWQLDVRSLFMSPTLAGLAATVRAGRDVPVPPNLIGAGCQRITPELLPLVRLSQPEIDTIVATVPSGVANVQDIYPLAPLQEGMLFQHLLETQGDTYLNSSLLSFDSRDRLDRFVAALQSVIERHDILRTAFAWQALDVPVQLVWRRASLPLEEHAIEGEDIAAQLLARFDPRRTRIDLGQAPLLRAHVAHDAPHGRWLMCLLQHHLIGDHTTLELLVEEVQAHLGGQAHRLPAPLPFRDFIAQTRLGLTHQQHEAFFREMLGDVEEPTAPFGLLDVQGDGSQVHEAHLPLPAELARELRAHARRLGVSAATLFHLAFALVLARTSGRADVVFGTVLFGRMQGGDHRVLGLFMNSLPLRLQLHHGVEEAVRATQARLAQLLHHEHAPLTLAQRASVVPAPAPLFTALLNYRYAGGSSVLAQDPAHDAAHAKQAWDGLQVLHAQERTNYPLALSVNDAGEDFSLDVQVDQRVDAQRVGRYMLQSLHALAQALQEAPSMPAHSLDVLPADERDQLLHGFNDTAAPFPAERCIHELFEAQVERTPEACALMFEDIELSYAELNGRANRLAHHLIALGVQPDTRVAIALPRGIEMVVALLATLKAGGAYVPLDPDYPTERLAFMLADSTPRVLLTDCGVRAALGELPPSLAVLALDDTARPWETGPAVTPKPRALGLTSAHLAYVIYTSGSAGAPKGVAIEHRNAVNFVHWGTTSFAPEALQRTLLSTSLNFDLAVFECFVPLSCGMAVHLVADALALTRQSANVTLINTVPSAMTALLDAASVPHTVRQVNLAGEPLKRALVQRLFASTTVETVCNLYGPSETTTYSTGVTMSRQGGFMASIGRPIANTSIYLLDALGQPVPVSVTGEIHIGGAGVSRGYLNRPDLTAERFVPDPFTTQTGARMYKTGDMGRGLVDGSIEFLGRNDHQVKLRGFRIELGEIEARLLEHPGVREAVVLAREDELSTGSTSRRLVAYVVGEPAQPEVQPETLRAHLASTLPEYMVPAAYVQLDALPLTPNGKLDRRALPAPEDRAFAARSFEPPQGELETTLAATWSELLGIECIGRHDNFFALGGHSLLAIQLISRIKDRLKIDLRLRDIFAQPQLLSMSSLILQRIDDDLRALMPMEVSGDLGASIADTN